MDPAQMKDSVKLGLEWARSQYDPHMTDVWLLAPADMPRLTPALIDRVLAAYDPRHPTICLPVHLSGRRGHPALFPWSLAGEVEELGEGESIKQIIQRHPVRSVAGEETAPFEDMDTPEDYAQIAGTYLSGRTALRLPRAVPAERGAGLLIRNLRARGQESESGCMRLFAFTGLLIHFSHARVRSQSLEAAGHVDRRN